jgi:hypothetical protein
MNTLPWASFYGDEDKVRALIDAGALLDVKVVHRIVFVHSCAIKFSN